MNEVAENPQERQKQETIRKSLEKPNALAKPGSLGRKGVRIRPLNWNKKIKIRKKGRKHDPRDVTFY